MAYTGLGDVVGSALGYYGLRAYSAAVAATGTQKAINIRRASDNTTLDILIRTDGYLDVVAASNFIGGSTGFVTKAYDQSGNGRDLSQATNANQPQLLVSGSGLYNTAQPVISASGTQFLSGTGVVNAQPISILNTFKYTVHADTRLFSTRSGGVNCFTGIDATNGLDGYAGNVGNTAAAISVDHIAIHVFNGASGITNTDGADGSGFDFGAGGTSASWAWMAEGDGTVNLTGFVAEAGVWPSSFGTTGDSTTRVAMYNNAHNFWLTSPPVIATGAGSGFLRMGPFLLGVGAGAKLASALRKNAVRSRRRLLMPWE